MRFGAMNFPVHPVLDEIDRIAKMGFDYLELSMDPPCSHYATLRIEQNQICAALKRHQMDIICHLPTFVYTADLSPAIRNASLDEMIKSLETACLLGAKKVVLHPSMISGLSHFVLNQHQNLAMDSFKILSGKARNLGIVLCVENMFSAYGTFFDPVHFKKLFEILPDIRMTLDAGHANIMDSNCNRAVCFIHEFHDRICHIHVSDNHGTTDDHLALGSGCLPLADLINTLIHYGYKDTVTFEIFSSSRQDLLKSKTLFQNLLNTCQTR